MRHTCKLNQPTSRISFKNLQKIHFNLINIHSFQFVFLTNFIEHLILNIALSFNPFLNHSLFFFTFEDLWSKHSDMFKLVPSYPKSFLTTSYH